MGMKKSYAGIFLIPLFFLVACASKPDLIEKGATLAVWDLDELTLIAPHQPHLGEVLALEIIQIIERKGDYSVIERNRFILVLQELKIGTMQIADESTRLKLGKLLGVRFMVFGGYQIIGNHMRLDLRLVEVETGRIRRAVQKTTSATNLDEWITAAQKAAEEL
jgi:TolB-like protein